MNTLEKLNDVVEERVNTNVNYSMTYEEIAKKLNLTVKEVKDAESSALNKLRHPRIGKSLKAL